jgi:dihydrolipoamide dehydrogenase
MSTIEEADVVVVGGGPAGILAALRAGDLGARTLLVTQGELGGMAAHDGPVPVRTLAHAARLLRDARQLERYGVSVAEPGLDYARLLARVREVTGEVRARAAFERELGVAHVVVRERMGEARFVDAYTIETDGGLEVRGKAFVLATGGASRRLSVPGFDLTATHSDAWRLTSVPPSMLVIGGGATGVQVASVFRTFGARVELFQAGPRILTTEDHDVALAVTAAFRAAGIAVREDFGTIEAFERAPEGVRMIFSKDGARSSASAAIAVVAVGWTADAARMNLAAAGVETTPRGFIRVDDHLRTTAPHVFAAGDVTGRTMLVPQALQDGFVAGTNAAGGPEEVSDGLAPAPIGGFSDPEYAQVGLTEASARQSDDVEVVIVPFDGSTRTIIDGRTSGFCKLVVDRTTRTILGCHVVGERAVDIVQAAAIAMTARMRVDELARVPLSFPTYTAVLGRAAAVAARRVRRESQTRCAESFEAWHVSQSR